MSENTSIEWCDATFNPWWGCTRISPGCDHCYAEHHARRFGVRWGTDAQRRIASEKVWAAPVKWNAQPYYTCDCGYRGTLNQLTTNIIHGCGSAVSGRPVNLRPTRRRVFCASMADVFDVDAPQGARDRLWALIRATPNLDWLLLTKRIGNAARMLPPDWGDGYPNVWLGATIVNQAEADRDVIKLLRTPARLRFVSVEPMLGPIRLWLLGAGDYEEVSCGAEVYALSGLRGIPDCDWQGTKIDWVICGGESGRNARPIHPDWARSLRDQCARSGTPFLFKQWGEWGQYVNEDDYTHSGAERRPHAWVDRDTAERGYCWLVDDDGSWSNYTGDPPTRDDGRVLDRIAVVGRYGKQAAGRLLDGVVHAGFPMPAGDA